MFSCLCAAPVVALTATCFEGKPEPIEHPTEEDTPPTDRSSGYAFVSQNRKGVKTRVGHKRHVYVAK